MEHTNEQTEEKRRRRWLLIGLLLILLITGSSLVMWWMIQPRGDTGSYLIPQGTMTDEEAFALVEEQAENSRITVSLKPAPELVDGQLHVNFFVTEDNNSFSERLEIEQDGAVVYRSGIVEPSHVIEWVDAPDAQVGAAVATIYAVDESGSDFGNPISIEIEIVEG
jgi:hypothetical protein